MSSPTDIEISGKTPSSVEHTVLPSNNSTYHVRPSDETPNKHDQETEKPLPPHLRRKGSSWKFVIGEILAIIISGSLIAGMAGLLNHYDDEPVPAWPKTYKETDPAWLQA